jgi:hypothetical protein
MFVDAAGRGRPEGVLGGAGIGSEVVDAVERLRAFPRMKFIGEVYQLTPDESPHPAFYSVEESSSDIGSTCMSR